MEYDHASDADVEAAESYMRNVLYEEKSKQTLLEKFALTRTTRRSFILKNEQVSASVILKKYPLLEHLEAVSEKLVTVIPKIFLFNYQVDADFNFYYKTSVANFIEKWNETVPVILDKAIQCKDNATDTYIHAAKSAKDAYGIVLINIFALLFLILFGLDTYGEFKAVFCIVNALMRNQRVIGKRFAKKPEETLEIILKTFEVHQLISH